MSIKTSDSGVVGNRSMVWLVRFWGLAALFYWLDHTVWFKVSIVAPYARFSATVTARLLTLLGIEFSINGSALTLSGKSFVVADSCTGSFVFLLLAAVIVSFPASLREKLIGLLAGFGTVVVLNLFRTLMIVVIASRFSGSFWGLHIIVGQALIIAGTLGVFIWWAKGVGHGRTLLSLGRRQLLLQAALYVVGFLFSYALYSFFLKSPLGTWFKGLVVSHAAFILGLFTETLQQGQIIRSAGSSIRVIHDCLSSPVLVLFLGSFFILPISWQKRFLLYLICFFPLYYFYHVTRTVTAVWFMTGGRDANFAYNFFGQIALVKALLIFSVYYWVGIRKLVTVARQLYIALAAIIPCVGVALLVGWGWQQLVLSSVVSSVFGSGKFYNPGQIVSMMPIFHTFSWVFLVLTTPLWSLRQRFVWGLIGCSGLNLFYALMVASLFVLELAPHPWLIKSGNIFLPFTCYFASLCFAIRPCYRLPQPRV